MFMTHQPGMTGQFPDEFVATEPAKRRYSPNPNQVVHVPEHNQNINTAT